MKIFQRVLHAVAVMGVVVGLSLLGFIVPVVVTAHLDLDQLSGSQMRWLERLAVAPWYLLWILIGFGVLAIWKKLSTKMLLLGWLVVGGLLLYLRWDQEQPKLVDLGPRVTNADEGYRVLMWMAKDSPYSRLEESGILPNNAADLRLPSAPKDWAAHVRTHRAEILRAWDQDVIGRAWVTAINARPPQGVWPQSLEDPMLSFQAVRASVSVRAVHAHLLALDGHRDEAIQSLVPLISAWQQFQRTGPCLVNQMIACVSLKMSYSVAGEVLSLGGVSVESKKSLLSTLNDSPQIGVVFRNAFLGEQAFIRGVCDNVQSAQQTLLETDSLKSVLEAGTQPNVFSGWMVRCRFPFVFNRHQTEEEHMIHFQLVCELAIAAKMEQLRALETQKSEVWLVKNPVGRCMLDSGSVAYSKIVENIWKAEELRIGLLKQLEKP